MAFYPQLILDALKHVRYPGTGKDIVSSEMVDDNIRIEGNKISFSLLLEKQGDPFAKSLVKAAEQAILTYVGAGRRLWAISASTTRRRFPHNLISCCHK